MNGYHYVYTLQSLNLPDEHYSGHTDDLKRRLAERADPKMPRLRPRGR